MTTTKTTTRVKCTVCGIRTRRPEGICAGCATNPNMPVPEATPEHANPVLAAMAAAPPVTTPQPVPDVAPVLAPVAPAKPTKKAKKAPVNGLAAIPNPFRTTSAQYAYFEIMRDGQAHSYDELNAEPKAKFPKDLVWFMLDTGRKSGAFVVIKGRDDARMEVK